MAPTTPVEVRIADLEPVAGMIGDLRDAVDEFRRREQAAVHRHNRSDGCDDHAAGEGDAYAAARRMVDEALARLNGKHTPPPDPSNPEPF